MKEKYAILLVRVSTLSQDAEPQVEDLRKYANERGYTNLEIIETKESGLIDLDKKSGTNTLFAFIKDNPKYNVVFATEISRLGRRQSVLHQIKEWFIANKIQLYVKDVGYSLLEDNGSVSTSGELMFSMYGLFAEAEIKQKKERFSRAKKVLMESGYSISGKTLFGYKRITLEGTPKRTTLVIDEVNANIVREIFKWYLQGSNVYEKRMSIKKIALECLKLGYPKYTHSKRNINKLLKEEGYTGEKITNNKRKNKNFQEGGAEAEYIISNNKIKYPLIISKDTYDLCQMRLKENNSKIDKSTKNITILSKLINCNKCKSHFTGNYRKNKGRNTSSYRCSSRSGTNNCVNKQSVSMSMLDSAIWCLIKTDLTALSKIISAFNPDKEVIENGIKLENLYKQREQINSAILNLKKRFNNFNMLKNIEEIDFVDIIYSKVEKLDKSKGEIENEIYKLEVEKTIKSENHKNIFKSIGENLLKIEDSKELLKKYIKLFINKIEVILHNQYFSIIYVENTSTINRFKIDDYFKNNTSKASISKITKDASISLNNYIILDKRNSQKIEAYRTHRKIISTKSKNMIAIKSWLGKDDILIHLNDLTTSKNSKYFTRFNFTKLNIY